MLPGALSPAEAAACLAASERVHANEAFVAKMEKQQVPGPAQRPATATTAERRGRRV